MPACLASEIHASPGSDMIMSSNSNLKDAIVLDEAQAAIQVRDTA